MGNKEAIFEDGGINYRGENSFAFQNRRSIYTGLY
jgi:hypothetical protein